MALSPEALVEIYVVQVSDGRPVSSCPLHPHESVFQPIFQLSSVPKRGAPCGCEPAKRFWSVCTVWRADTRRWWFCRRATFPAPTG